MLYDYSNAGMDLREMNPRKIDPEGVFRRMQECGHCPLRDTDYGRLGKVYGVGAGTMLRFVMTHELDKRLEEETMYQKMDQDKAMDLYRQGLSDTAMAKQLGLDKSTIAHWRRKRGMEANGRPWGPVKAAVDEPVAGCDEPAPTGLTTEIPTAEETVTVEVDVYAAIREMQAKIDRLETRELFLVGVAIGAGVHGIKAMLEALG